MAHKPRILFYVSNHSIWDIGEDGKIEAILGFIEGALNCLLIFPLLMACHSFYICFFKMETELLISIYKKG